MIAFILFLLFYYFATVYSYQNFMSTAIQQIMDVLQGLRVIRQLLVVVFLI